MKKHYNRFASGLGALLVICLGAPPAVAAVPENPEPAVHASSANWLDRVILILEIIHGITQGDVPKLRQEPTLSGKLALVAGQYAAHGIPEDLSESEKQALTGAIDELYTYLVTPPTTSPIQRPDSFLKVLMLMWMDLGMPVEELGMNPD